MPAVSGSVVQAAASDAEACPQGLEIEGWLIVGIGDPEATAEIDGSQFEAKLRP